MRIQPQAQSVDPDKAAFFNHTEYQLKKCGGNSLRLQPRESAGMAYSRQSHSGSGPFPQDIPAKAKQFGGPASGFAVQSAGAFNKAAGFNKTTEVLFVQAHSREGFDNLLQLKRCKSG